MKFFNKRPVTKATTYTTNVNENPVVGEFINFSRASNTDQRAEFQKKLFEKHLSEKHKIPSSIPDPQNHRDFSKDNLGLIGKQQDAYEGILPLWQRLFGYPIPYVTRSVSKHETGGKPTYSNDPTYQWNSIINVQAEETIDGVIVNGRVEELTGANRIEFDTAAGPPALMDGSRSARYEIPPEMSEIAISISRGKRDRITGALVVDRSSKQFPNLNLPDGNGGQRKLIPTAFVCHHGGVGGGHYVAYVLDKTGWFLYDDGNVSPVVEQQAMQEAQANATLVKYSQEGILPEHQVSGTPQANGDNNCWANALMAFAFSFTSIGQPITRPEETIRRLNAKGVNREDKPKPKQPNKPSRVSDEEEKEDLPHPEETPPARTPPTRTPSQDPFQGFVFPKHAASEALANSDYSKDTPLDKIIRKHKEPRDLPLVEQQHIAGKELVFFTPDEKDIVLSAESVDRSNEIMTALLASGIKINKDQKFISFVNEGKHWNIVVSKMQGDAISSVKTTCEADGACGMHAIMQAIIKGEGSLALQYKKVTDEYLKLLAVKQKAVATYNADPLSESKGDAQTKASDDLTNFVIDFGIKVLAAAGARDNLDDKKSDLYKKLKRLRVDPARGYDEQNWLEDKDIEIFGKVFGLPAFNVQNCESYQKDEFNKLKQSFIEKCKSKDDGSIDVIANQALALTLNFTNEEKKAVVTELRESGVPNDVLLALKSIFGIEEAKTSEKPVWSAEVLLAEYIKLKQHGYKVGDELSENIKGLLQGIKEGSDSEPENREVAELREFLILKGIQDQEYQNLFLLEIAGEAEEILGAQEKLEGLEKLRQEQQRQQEAKKAAEAKAKAEQEAEAKAAKAKAEQEAKKAAEAKAEQEAKEKAEQEAKEKAEQEAKAKAAKEKAEQEAEAKAKAAEAKAEQEKKLNELLLDCEKDGVSKLKPLQDFLEEKPESVDIVDHAKNNSVNAVRRANHLVRILMIRKELDDAKVVLEVVNDRIETFNNTKGFIANEDENKINDEGGILPYTVNVANSSQEAFEKLSLERQRLDGKRAQYTSRLAELNEKVREYEEFYDIRVAVNSENNLPAEIEELNQQEKSLKTSEAEFWQYIFTINPDAQEVIKQKQDLIDKKQAELGLRRSERTLGKLGVLGFAKGLFGGTKQHVKPVDELEKELKGLHEDLKKVKEEVVQDIVKKKSLEKFDHILNQTPVPTATKEEVKGALSKFQKQLHPLFIAFIEGVNDIKKLDDWQKALINRVEAILAPLAIDYSVEALKDKPKNNKYFIALVAAAKAKDPSVAEKLDMLQAGIVGILEAKIQDIKSDSRIIDEEAVKAFIQKAKEVQSEAIEVIESREQLLIAAKSNVEKVKSETKKQELEARIETEEKVFSASAFSGFPKQVLDLNSSSLFVQNQLAKFLYQNTWKVEWSKLSGVTMGSLALLIALGHQRYANSTKPFDYERDVNASSKDILMFIKEGMEIVGNLDLHSSSNLIVGNLDVEHLTVMVFESLKLMSVSQIKRPGITAENAHILAGALKDIGKVIDSKNEHYSVCLALKGLAFEELRLLFERLDDPAKLDAIKGLFIKSNQLLEINNLEALSAQYLVSMGSETIKPFLTESLVKNAENSLIPISESKKALEEINKEIGSPRPSFASSRTLKTGLSGIEKGLSGIGKSARNLLGGTSSKNLLETPHDREEKEDEGDGGTKVDKGDGGSKKEGEPPVKRALKKTESFVSRMRGKSFGSRRGVRFEDPHEEEAKKLEQEKEEKKEEIRDILNDESQEPIKSLELLKEAYKEYKKLIGGDATSSSNPFEMMVESRIARLEKEPEFQSKVAELKTGVRTFTDFVSQARKAREARESTLRS